MNLRESRALRWQDYVMAFGGSDDPSEELWEAAARAAGGGRSRYMLGVGFDPRALVGLQKFLGLDHRVTPVIGVVELPPPSPASGAVARALAADNREAFRNLTLQYEVRSIPHQEVHSRSNAGPRVSRAATSAEFMYDIGHLILDISSLPSSLYFPILAAGLTSFDRNIDPFPREIQVVACENPDVDAAVDELGVSEALVVGGFRGGLEYESEPSGTVIWAPVVGENAGPALVAIHEFLTPDDVFPILPFPARNPRRGDQLLLEHQVELLDGFGVGAENIIFADEHNPFDLYRTLSRLESDLRLALDGLGRTTLAVSTHASKVLSLGVLLAAYERQLPIVAAPPLDYELMNIELAPVAAHHQVSTAWLAGLPYARRS